MLLSSTSAPACPTLFHHWCCTQSCSGIDPQSTRLLQWSPRWSSSWTVSSTAVRLLRCCHICFKPCFNVCWHSWHTSLARLSTTDHLQAVSHDLQASPWPCSSLPGTFVNLCLPSPASLYYILLKFISCLSRESEPQQTLWGFHYAAPAAWNALPPLLRDPELSLTQFSVTENCYVSLMVYVQHHCMHFRVSFLLVGVFEILLLLFINCFRLLLVFLP